MDKETIERYFNNRCTEEEREKIQRWINEEGAQWFELYFDKHYHNAQVATAPNADMAVFERVLAAVKSKQTEDKADAGNKARVIGLRKIGLYQRWWVAAACMILLAGAGWLYQQQNKVKADDSVNGIAWVEVVNPSREVKRVVLPDSSRVALNRGSHIRYSKIFDEKERIVELTGEAFFNVTHNDHKPFIVKAGNAETVVYGTAFNIHAYPGEEQTAIALQRGRIGVRIIKQGRSIEEKILSPGQLYQYDSITGRNDITNIPAEHIDGWMHGGLSFYDTPLKDVIKQVERKFDVRFQLSANASIESTFTAYFPAVTLEQVLNHLRFTGDLEFRRESNSNVIYVE